ncbi:MAG: hypothetical protein C0501_08740 [Isosphaera sp.]|nr:hypothetical protein [Isosphaera sp.]
MADKLTQQLTDALARAAAHPGGLPLFAGKTDPGLFPSTAAARPAAQKCVAENLVRAAGTDPSARTPRDLYALTDAGWEFLLAQVNPKQVLEDFVRVLEARRGEVGELLATARRMADNLQGLKDAVARVLPAVAAARVRVPGEPRPSGSGCDLPTRSLTVAVRPEFEPEPAPVAVAVLDAEPDLAAAVLARLADWSGSAGEDCPLPDLYRALSPAPTIGRFHDCLRALQADGAVYLHPWTGPLYAMPEPTYALLAGHGVAYYASLRPEKG